MVAPVGPQDRGEEEEKKKKRQGGLEERRKAFLDKIIDPFTEVDHLRDMLMQPVPKGFGMIECSIVRDKGGLNKLFPKYTLVLTVGMIFLTACRTHRDS